GGPMSVITNMATLGFDEKTRALYLTGYFPGISPQTILTNMGFEIDIKRAVEVMPPTADELRILRERCDPQRLIL
ncbi:MAG: ketoacid-CoA transferase, partial [Desulfatirhabdiaceae bacterium]